MDTCGCSKIYVITVMVLTFINLKWCESILFRKVTTGLSTMHLKCYNVTDLRNYGNMLQSVCGVRCSQMDLCYYFLVKGKYMAIQYCLHQLKFRYF